MSKFAVVFFLASMLVFTPNAPAQNEKAFRLSGGPKFYASRGHKFRTGYISNVFLCEPSDKEQVAQDFTIYWVDKYGGEANSSWVFVYDSAEEARSELRRELELDGKPGLTEHPYKIILTDFEYDCGVAKSGRVATTIPQPPAATKAPALVIRPAPESSPALIAAPKSPPPQVPKSAPVPPQKKPEIFKHKDDSAARQKCFAAGNLVFQAQIAYDNCIKKHTKLDKGRYVDGTPDLKALCGPAKQRVSDTQALRKSSCGPSKPVTVIRQ